MAYQVASYSTASSLSVSKYFYFTLKVPVYTLSGLILGVNSSTSFNVQAFHTWFIFKATAASTCIGGMEDYVFSIKVLPDAIRFIPAYITAEIRAFHGKIIKPK